jgi:hypothetical protein
MSTELKLLPCPFCGGTDAFVERLDYSAAYVQCDSRIDEHSACLARGPVGVQDDDGEEVPGAAAAIRAWNEQAARRSAPVSAPIGEELPKWIDDHKGADPFMDDVIAYIESMHSQYAERIRQLERELAERKPASIGDDSEFLRLLGDWMAGLDYFQSDEHKEVKIAWATLIAYIDGRTAGTAPEGWARVPQKPTREMLQAARLSWACNPGFDVEAIYAAMIVAAPSPLNSGKEEE